MTIFGTIGLVILITAYAIRTRTKYFAHTTIVASTLLCIHALINQDWIFVAVQCLVIGLMIKDIYEQ